MNDPYMAHHLLGTQPNNNSFHYISVIFEPLEVLKNLFFLKNLANATASGSFTKNVGRFNRCDDFQLLFKILTLEDSEYSS